MSKRDAYIEKMKLQLDELNAKMSAVEAKAEEASDDVREKYNEEMRKLRHQSEFAFAKLDQLKLDQLKEVGDESWDKLVTEMTKVRDAFKHSFNYFKSQL